jgi:succinyl-CoA synthetase alpha subunit
MTTAPAGLSPVLGGRLSEHRARSILHSVLMGEATVRTRVVSDTYRDSVVLMRIAADVERRPGVRRAAVLMGTPANLALLDGAGLLRGEAAEARPGDLVLAVAADTAALADEALDRAVDAMTAAPPAAAAAEAPSPRTLAAALADRPAANLAIVSVPGPYATAEALKALKRGLHVFLFSDNVGLDDERMLKDLAVRKGLLCLGPDCGTAILDGVPLGFANAVRRGRIGLVGASGTGLQALSCLVDRLGEGVSHAIGVGGHDLHEAIGGRMMLAGLDRLDADPATAVIVLVSKPPAPAVAARVLARAHGCGKPVVACFLGAAPGAVDGGAAAATAPGGVAMASTLEAAAMLAVARARRAPAAALADDRELLAAVAAEARRLAPSQHVIHGLYSGGTLRDEAAHVIAAVLGAGAAGAHRLVDLGDDAFTVGRPHPMIDDRLRTERLAALGDDPSAAVVLLDVVLGHGSHPDPAPALAAAVGAARRRAASAGRHLVAVASVCGTAADPQGLERQEAGLREGGVLVAISNARAARLAALAVREAGRG